MYTEKDSIHACITKNTKTSAQYNGDCIRYVATRNKSQSDSTQL